jgi:P2 family phage major capsid protein
MPLSTAAEAKLSSYFDKIAEYNNIPRKEVLSFAASPTTEQILANKIVEQAGWFAPYFTMLMVRDLVGQKVLMNLSGATASRTNTDATDRVTKSFLDLTTQDYLLRAIEFNTHMKFSDIDAWSKFPDFEARYQALLMLNKFNALVMSGWHGGGGIVAGVLVNVDPAATTNSTTYPLLQDLCKGWLRLIRDFNSGSQHFMGTADIPMAIGSVDYPNLDVLVAEAKNKIKPWLRGNLVAYISDDLVAREEGKFYASKVERASEKLIVMQNGGEVLQSYGGLRAIVPPFFPDSTVLVTQVGNLQFYTQEGSMRRTIQPWPAGNHIKDYSSSNAGHVVYNEEAAILYENISFVN